MPDWAIIHTEPMLGIAEGAFRDSHIYLPPYLLTKLMASVGCHVFNLANHRAKAHMDGPHPTNFRMSIALLAPSGFCKSTFQKMLVHKDGLLSRFDMPTNIEGTFTPESWVGTRLSRDESGVDPSAVFAYYKSGIAAADEFERLVLLMDGDGSLPEEVYMLQGLDKPDISKRHSLGQITLGDICTTIWPALRPPTMPMRMHSGLGRRFMFCLLLPGPEMWGKLDDAMWDKVESTRTVNGFEGYRSRMQIELAHALETLPQNMPPLSFSAVKAWCHKHKQPPFVSGILQRIALGLAIVRGTYPLIPVDAEVEGVFMDEIRSRRILKNDAMAQAVRNSVIESSRMSGKVAVGGFEQVSYPAWSEVELMRFMLDYYQLSLVQAKGAVNAALALGMVKRSGGDLLAPDRKEEDI